MARRSDFFELSFAEAQHQISEELQLIGDLLDSRLKLVAGLYYFNEGGYIHDYVTFGGGLLQVDGPNTLNTTSYAGYLHLDYKLTDQIGLTLGGRESSDRKTFTGGQQDLNGFFQRLIGGCYAGYPATPTPACQAILAGDGFGFTNPNNPYQVYPLGENHQNFTEFTPTAGIQYHFDPEPDDLRRLRQGLQDRRLDHAIDCAAAARIAGAGVRAGDRPDLRGGIQVGVA